MTKGKLRATPDPAQVLDGKMLARSTFGPGAAALTSLDVSLVTTGFRMSLRERVVVLLASQPNRELCVSCIARALGTLARSAHEATLKLEASAAFQRRYGVCAVCGKTRIVVGKLSA